ncbi:heavy metal translocating P-type ATPase [Enorma phocaeensis]|uniref:heavy metal translocating P-type ATPase n=1 Tax=Enorma phocaeensis TaxID=1871019 RepID=UPI00320BAE94
MIEGLEKLLEWGGAKRDIAFLAISGVALALSLAGVEPFPFSIAWVAIILCGVPIILEAVIGLLTEFDITADVLVSLALIASVFIGEDFAAGEVAFIMQLGGLLEELTVARARAGIERLVHLTPRTARRIARATAEGGEPRPVAEETIAAEAVQVGDILRVLPGEAVPVDGVIVSGQTSVNQAVMTGESLPVDKGPGDEVSSGTVNQFGSFDMAATRVGEDSSIQRMIRLVQSADAGKAKIVNLADRWTVWIVVIALAAAVVTYLATGEIIRSVTILVVFCPCALVLATPTAIMAAIGNATRHGFLVREGDALERLAQVVRVCFDKTGTLTLGKPQVVDVHAGEGGVGADVLLAIAGSAEKRSEHPLGRAIAAAATAHAGAEPDDPTSFAMVPGRGVVAQVGGRTVYAGSAALLAEHGLAVPEALEARAASERATGATITYLGWDGSATGFIALADRVRADAAATLAAVREAGVEPVLLTGDHEAAAAHVAGELGITIYRAACLPEDKLAFIDASERSGAAVCMVGDGVNDAPALKRALVGIAMGGVGSDIAVDAADIALVNDDIAELPHLLRLSRRMMTTIKINLTFSMTLNFIAIALAISGALNPVVGALVHNAGSVLVIVNSALLLGWKPRVR